MRPMYNRKGAAESVNQLPQNHTKLLSIHNLLGYKFDKLDAMLVRRFTFSYGKSSHSYINAHFFFPSSHCQWTFGR